MARKKPLLATISGTPLGRASVDSVLEYAGVSHPAVATHLLATYGMLIMSVGALVTGPLLPIPLYSCWGGLGFDEVPRSLSCAGIKLLPSAPLNYHLHFWECAAQAPWWAPVSATGLSLALVRVLLTFIGGLLTDIHGRRRACVVAMGVYFVFSLSRSFAPNVEVSIVAIVLEGAAVQTATFALILIALENSTQKECMRAVCLVLLGHSLGAGGAAATIDTLFSRHLSVQLLKSLPSVTFVVLLCWLPESVRWVLSRGDWADASLLFPRTHNITLDESIRPKLMAVQQESQRCLAAVGCRGSIFRRSLCPLFRCAALFRVAAIGVFCAATFGLMVGTRLILDPSPYVGLADRTLALGAVELLVLLLTGLLLGRVAARPLLSVAFLALAACVSFTPIFGIVGLETCAGEVVVSLVGHGCAVATAVALVVSLGRLAPTHSRGTLMGLCWAFASGGYAAAGPLLQLLDDSHPTMAKYNIRVYICASLSMMAGLLAIALPDTPAVLPDSLSHISRKLRDEMDFEYGTPLHNTRL